MLFDVPPEPVRPTAANDLSGLTCLNLPLLSSLYIKGVMLYLYSIADVYSAMPLSLLSRKSMKAARSLELDLLRISVTVFISLIFLPYSSISSTALPSTPFPFVEMSSPFDLSLSLLLSPSFSDSFDPLIPSAVEIIDVRSKPVSCIWTGYSARVSSSTVSIYLLTPLERDRIKAIPMIPIDPANATRIVLPFFVMRLLKLSERAVRNDMLARFCFSLRRAAAVSSSGFSSMLAVLISGTAASSGVLAASSCAVSDTSSDGLSGF